MKITLASDHGGLALKKQVIPFIQSLGVEVEDVGCFDATSVDYPDYAAQVAHKVSTGQSDRGILVCGSGIGMAIAANKIKGIRAHAVGDLYSARMAREHNDLNVLCLGGRVLGEEVAKEIIKIFIETPFAGGRHQGRVNKIHQLEE